MAATSLLNGVQHAAAGDTTTGRYLVSALIWNGSGTAGDDLSVKDGDGNLLLNVKSDGSQFQEIAYPFGRKFVTHGIETDVIDAGTVVYIWE